MSHPLDPQPNKRPAKWWENVIAAVVFVTTLGVVFLILSWVLTP